jgi:hypothetical protein
MWLVSLSLRNKSGNLPARPCLTFSARPCDDSSMTLFSLVTLFVGVSFAHDEKFPRTVLPHVCMDGQLPTDDAVQACLSALNRGTQLPFNCTHMSQLVYSGAAPFASGTWKEAFRAQWLHHQTVVVKRNRRHQSSGRRSIVFEAIRMILLQAPAHISLLGHCSVDSSLALNVVAAADPWPDIVDSAPWPLAVPHWYGAALCRYASVVAQFSLWSARALRPAARAVWLCQRRASSARSRQSRAGAVHQCSLGLLYACRSH